MGAGVTFRMDDLPPRYKAQVQSQLSHTSKFPPAQMGTAQKRPVSRPKPKPSISDIEFSQSHPEAPIGGKWKEYKPTVVAEMEVKKDRGTPNKTEQEYNRKFLGGRGRYEAITIRTPGGNYTPDYLTIDDGKVTLHECKGDFRFASQSRSVLAFKTAAAFYPCWRFVWATKHKKGEWEVKEYLPDDPLNEVADGE